MLLKPLLLATISVALLNGCGGGGGGDGGSGSGSGGAGAQASGVTVSAFSSGASLSNLKLMNFYGSDLHVMGTNQTDNLASVLKFNSAGVYQSRIGTINNPQGIAFYSDGKTLVSGGNPLSGSGLMELNRANGALTDKVIGVNGYGIAVNPATTNSDIYLAIPSTNRVMVYTAAYVQVASINVPNWPTALVYSSQGTDAYVYVTQNDGGANGVRRINVNNTASFDQFNSALFDKAAGIAIRTNTTPHEIYVVNTGTTEAASSVVKVSLDGSSVSQVLTAANPDHKLCSPVGIAISGSVLYVANTTCTNAPNSSYANVILKVQL